MNVPEADLFTLDNVCHMNVRYLIQQKPEAVASNQRSLSLNVLMNAPVRLHLFRAEHDEQKRRHS
jgi:hypothetical protein